MSKAEVIVYSDDFAPDLDMRPPSVDSINEQKIMATLKVFWGDIQLAEPQAFKDIEAAMTYFGSVEKSCMEVIGGSLNNLIRANAATMVRRHHTATIINSLLQTYTEAEVRDRMTKDFGISAADFYALRKIAEGFTVEEVFAFGMHRGDFKQLKCLARIPDDTVRKAVFTKYCQLVENSCDVKQASAAVKYLNEAISLAKLPENLELDGGGSDEAPAQDIVDEIPENLRNAMTSLTKLHKLVRMLSPGVCQEICRSCAEMYIPEGIAPGKLQVYCDQILEKARETFADLDKVLEGLTDVRQELMSVTGCVVDTETVGDSEED